MLGRGGGGTGEQALGRIPAPKQGSVPRRKEIEIKLNVEEEEEKVNIRKDKRKHDSEETIRNRKRRLVERKAIKIRQKNALKNMG
jgi:hypothetical protein